MKTQSELIIEKKAMEELCAHLLKQFTLAKPIVFVAGKAAFDPETVSQLMRGGYCVLRCKQEDVELVRH